MCEMGGRPDDDSDAAADFRAEAVDYAPKGEVTNAVGSLKPEDNVAIADLAPAIFLLERGLEDAENLSIDIV
jgi:hypothetical protein